MRRLSPSTTRHSISPYDNDHTSSPIFGNQPEVPSSSFVQYEKALLPRQHDTSSLSFLLISLKPSCCMLLLFVREMQYFLNDYLKSIVVAIAYITTLSNHSPHPLPCIASHAACPIYVLMNNNNVTCPTTLLSNAPVEFLIEGSTFPLFLLKLNAATRDDRRNCSNCSMALPYSNKISFFSLPHRA